MIYKPLYKRATNGKINQWTIEIDHNKFRTIAGYHDGVQTTSEWTVCDGKNIGKKNETTPERQAKAEADALYRKRKEVGFFDNINITTDTAFTNVEEAPFVKYDGKIFDNDGDTFTGGDVSVYEIKYPNFVTVYKVVEDIDKSFPVLDPKDKGEEGGVDPSVTEKEDVNASGFDLFKAAILEKYRTLSESIISWIPKGQSAFWLNSNYNFI